MCDKCVVLHFGFMEMAKPLTICSMINWMRMDAYGAKHGRHLFAWLYNFTIFYSQSMHSFVCKGEPVADPVLRAVNPRSELTRIPCWFVVASEDHI